MLKLDQMDSSPKTPLVSVVMPAYNSEKFVGLSIESILNQSFEAFELILIDDCSSDTTLEILKKYEALDSRVRVFANSQNLGIAGNRNYGLSLSVGKYLAWQDADDISRPTRIALQYAFLEAHPDVGIVGGAMHIFSDLQEVGVRRYPCEDSQLRRCIYRYSPVAQPAAMLRLSALKLAGLYDLAYPPAEDLDMTFRIGEHYKLANVPEILIDYRVSSESATSGSQRVMEMNTLKIRFKNARSKAYGMNFGDVIFNLLHFISLWVVPPKIKVWIFNCWRNPKSR